MLAAGTGNVDTVDLLLQCGAIQSINTKDLVGIQHGWAAFQRTFKQTLVFVTSGYFWFLVYSVYCKLDVHPAFC